jgi:transposase
MTRENEIIRLYNEGLSGNQIAKQISLGKTRVYEILKQYNANIDAKRYTRGIHSSGKKALSPEATMDFVKQLITQSEYTKISKDATRKEFPFEYYCIEYHYKTITNAIKLSGEYVLDKGVPKRWSKDFLIVSDTTRLRFKYAIEFGTYG